jgi:DDE superfamily endonuclease
MPCELMNLRVAFAPLFSKPVFQHLHVLLIGAILAPRKRTVTSALRVMGKSQDAHFQNYQRVLNRAVWSALSASRILLGLLVATFAPKGVLVMGLDDTIERRRGDQIKATGIYRDPVRSSHSHFVKASGLRWLCLMLVVEIAWAGRCWALPFLTALCPSQRYHKERGRPPQKLTERARQMRAHVTLITRLRMDAALYEPAPERSRGQMGRPRKKGKRLPTWKQVAADPQTGWQQVRVRAWYGEGERQVEVVSGTCLGYHTGRPAVPIRWVLVRDPQEKFSTQALVSTKLDAAPVQILQWFVWRWRVEVTCEEVRAHLGVETQRQWSEKAIARTTPSLLGLYSLTALLAASLLKQQELPARRAAWYGKQSATFSDTIAWVRRWLWSHQHFQMSETKAEMIKVPRLLLERLTETLCYAA